MATLDSDTRTDASGVREIFETSLSDGELNAWINMAHRVVERDLGSASVNSGTLADIEKNLAAHLASSDDPRVVREDVADASFDYQRDPNETDYWRNVVLLDPTGRLAAANQPSASFEALGPGR